MMTVDTFYERAAEFLNLIQGCSPHQEGLALLEKFGPGTWSITHRQEFSRWAVHLKYQGLDASQARNAKSSEEFYSQFHSYVGAFVKSYLAGCRQPDKAAQIETLLSFSSDDIQSFVNEFVGKPLGYGYGHDELNHVFTASLFEISDHLASRSDLVEEVLGFDRSGQKDGIFLTRSDQGFVLIGRERGHEFLREEFSPGLLGTALQTYLKKIYPFLLS